MSDSSNQREPVDRLLEAIRDGNEEAEGELSPLIYAELRRLAHSSLRLEGSDHTLRTTALVNEAFLRLASSSTQDWKNRAYFFGAAANAMRQALIQHYRDRSRLKRGGESERKDIEIDDIKEDEIDDTIIKTNIKTKDKMLIRLDDALYALKRLNKTQARIVEMRFFGGLTLEEIAEVMNVSLSTVKNHWRHAKAWLKEEIES